MDLTILPSGFLFGRIDSPGSFGELNELQYLCSCRRSSSAKFSVHLLHSMAPTSKPRTPSPTPTWLDTAPAVGKAEVDTAVSEDVEVKVTTGPGPELLGLEVVLPAGGGEPSPLGLFEDGGGDAGGGMIVVADAAGVVTVDEGDPVTAPVEAVLLWLSPLSVHKVVVPVATTVVSVSLADPVVVSELDEAEAEEDEMVTLCVNVVAVVVVAEDEVAV